MVDVHLNSIAMLKLNTSSPAELEWRYEPEWKDKQIFVKDSNLALVKLSFPSTF